MPLSCPVCGTARVERLLPPQTLPASVAGYFGTLEAARACPRGTVALHLCPACTYVWNAAFDAAQTVYAPGYSASLAHSPRYAAFLERTADALGRRHGLSGQRVVEAGCGDGHFLALLAARTGCEALGIDPSAPEAALPGVRFLREPLGPAHAGLGAALALCRHALHYMPDPVAFLRLLGTAGAAVYAEVPNAAHVFAEGIPWALFYEHAGYFSAPALRRACEQAGLHSTAIHPCYADGQYLYAEATRAGDGPKDAAGTGLDVNSDAKAADERGGAAAAAWAFAARYRARLKHARGFLDALAGRRVALWGAAGRGATFLAHCDPEAARVLAVADSNPARHGSFVPGTGHPIVAPETLAALRPEMVLLTNVTYAAEITAQAHALGLTADFAVL